MPNSALSGPLQQGKIMLKGNEGGRGIMTVAFELSAGDTKFVERWAADKQMSISDLARQMFLERIEEERDLQL